MVPVDIDWVYIDHERAISLMYRILVSFANAFVVDEKAFRAVKLAF